MNALRSRGGSALTLLAAICLTAASASAGVIRDMELYPGSKSGGLAIPRSGLSLGTDWWWTETPAGASLGMDQTWVGLDSSEIIGKIEADSRVRGGPSVVNFDLTINNTSGFDWTGFTIKLSPISPGGSTFVDPGTVTVSRFSDVMVDNAGDMSLITLTLSGGDTPVLIGESFDAKFDMQLVGFAFDVVLTPIPEPASVGLLLLGGFVMLRSWRRAA